MGKLFYFVGLLCFINMAGFAADATPNRESMTKRIAEILVNNVKEAEQGLLNSVVASPALSTSNYPTARIKRPFMNVTYPLYEQAQQNIALVLMESMELSDDMIHLLGAQMDSPLYRRYDCFVKEELSQLSHGVVHPMKSPLSVSQRTLSEHLGSLPGATVAGQPMNERIAHRFSDEEATKLSEIFASAVYHKAVTVFNRNFGR